MEVLLNINTWETFRYQPITFYNGYTLCKYVLMSLRCLRLSLCLSDTNQLLSLSDRGWGKNVGFKHRCQAWRGMGGRFSPYSSMCRKTDPLLPRAQSASLPYVRLIDVWLSDCIEIQILSTGAFRYGSTLAFTPAPRITHLMDVLVWISDWTQIMFTELLSSRFDFCRSHNAGKSWNLSVPSEPAAV